MILAAYTLAAATRDADYLADLVRKVATDYLACEDRDGPSSRDFGVFMQNKFLILRTCARARAYSSCGGESDLKKRRFNGVQEHAIAEQLLCAIDELYVTLPEQLSLEKCRYLQALVLHKEPVMFAAYDVFANDGRRRGVPLVEVFRLSRASTRRGRAVAREMCERIF